MSDINNEGQVGVEYYLKALCDNDDQVREAAASALGALGDPQAVVPLIEALEDSALLVRGAAAGALGALGDARAFEPLVRALGDSHRWVHEAAVKALVALKDGRTVGLLIEALGDGQLLGREAAARALGALEDRRALDPLVEALGSGDSPVRLAAANALVAFGEPKWKRWIHGNPEDFERLARSGEPRVFGLFVKALGDCGLATRKAIVKAISMLADRRCVEPLTKALGDRYRPIRVAAASALGELGDPRAVEPLIAALGDSEWLVREAATKALEAMGDARAVEPLIAVLGDRHKPLREAAAIALGELDPQCLELTSLPILELVHKYSIEAPFSDTVLALRVETMLSDLRNDTFATRRDAAENLRRVAHLCPSMIIHDWQKIRDLVQAPRVNSTVGGDHTDFEGYSCSDDHSDYRSESHHEDSGIGLDFPDQPPDDTARDF